MTGPIAPRFRWTARADGDFAGDLSGRQAGWTWLRQVHGSQVVVVRTAGEHAGTEADAAVTETPGCPLVVRTADCAPVVLVGTRTVGIVHAGWRGLLDGVIERTVAAVRALGDDPVAAHLGPCIRPGCYEFEEADAAPIAERYGSGVLARTSWGTAALDLPAAVEQAVARAGVARWHDDAGCTACDRRWFSHRARAEPERFATVAWLEAG